MSTWHKLKWPLIALGLVLLFNLFFTTGFFHLEIKNGRLYGSLVDVLNRAAPTMLLALGMTLVIATGGVDLSVGSVMAIAGSIAALLLTKTHQSVSSVIAISLGVSFVLGLWNGTLVGFFKITPIVATLILMVSGRGLAQLLTDGQIITFENKSFEYVGRGTFLGLPFTITLVIVVYLFLVLFTKKTAAGLFIESTGDNEKASDYAGVNTKLVKLMVYSICSVLAGLAGLIVTTDIKAADANNAGLWLELDAILATVIGGTALTGGRFFLAGSLIGAILIQALTTTILTRGVPVEWTLVVKAVVIIAVCLLQSESFRKQIALLTRRSPQTT
jgi:ribose/xylose/arabinose/galactoside ABC-type transport system permease subunit